MLGFLSASLVGTAVAEIGAPTNLARTSYDTNTRAISLSWDDNSSNESLFDIQVSSDGGATWTDLGESASGTTTFHGTAPASEKLLFFRVVATDGTDFSAASNLVSSNGTNPEIADSDGDGMTDAFETRNGLDPSFDDSHEDADGDRYPNIVEFARGTDASDPDSIPAADYIVDLVPSASENVFADIQTALDQVDADYQVILLREGNFSGSGNVGLTLPAGHPVLLIGEKGAKTSEIDGEGAARLLTVNGTAFIDGITFSNGHSSEGGALYLKSGSLQLVNCVFRANQADQKGGAIYQEAGILSVIHSTLVRNSAGQSGVALQVGGGAAMILKSILWNGSAGSEISSTGGSVEISDSIVRGGHAGQGNLDTDPMVQPDGRLNAGSPAIDQGGILQTAMRDMDGETRPAGATTDIGADEWHAAGSGVGENDPNPQQEGDMAGSQGAEGNGTAGGQSGQDGPGAGSSGSDLEIGGGNQVGAGSGGRIIYVDGEIGDDSKSGLKPTPTGNDAPKQTVTAAIEEARAGDTIVLDGGVYREAINFNFPGEGKVIISASEPVILGMDTVVE